MNFDSSLDSRDARFEDIDIKQPFVEDNPVIKVRYINENNASGSVRVVGEDGSYDDEDDDDDDDEEDDGNVVLQDPRELRRGKDFENLDLLLRLYAVKHVSTKRFWPAKVLNKIMTPRNIMDELVSYRIHFPTTLHRDVDHLANTINGWYRMVFAILNILSKGEDIEEFIREGISDEYLPLKSQTSGHILYRTDLSGGSVPCQATKSWSSLHRDNFAEIQYQLKPIFLEMGADGHTVKELSVKSREYLPIMKQRKIQEGGFGVVTWVKIHPDSHGFKDILPSIRTDDAFALKELRKSGTVTTKQLESEFRKELDNLKRFNGFHDDHLITLLSAWTLKKRHYLLFPEARSDLDAYWINHSRPDLDVYTVRWISSQVLGLCSALDRVHNPPSNVLLPTEDVRYGRHGDLKPQNILWYDSPKYDRGIWIIADLGLTELNSVFSRSNKTTAEVIGTPKYKSPECDLVGGRISRSYDIWTFGCVLLELVIWALQGSSARLGFLQRLKTPYLTGSKSDKFFDIKRKKFDGGHVVLVKQEVNNRIAELHNSHRCTQFFHDLLDLIEDGMIITLAAEPKRVRIDSGRLKTRLEEMHRDVTNTTGYGINRCPAKRVPKYATPVDATFRERKLRKILDHQLETHTGASERAMGREQLSKH